MDTEKIYCPHCHRNIATASWPIHEPYCNRHNYFCEECEQVIQKFDRDSHYSQFHRLVACDSCRKDVKITTLPDHQQNTCVNRPVECIYCELSVRFCEFCEHEEICGSRTEKCEICKKWVQYRHQAIHVCEEDVLIPPQYQHNEPVQEELIICPYCLDPSQDYLLLQEHIFIDHPELIDEE